MSIKMTKEEINAVGNPYYKVFMIEHNYEKLKGYVYINWINEKHQAYRKMINICRWDRYSDQQREKFEQWLFASIV